MGPGPGSARRGREARPARQGGASSHVLTEVPRPAPGRSRGRLAGPSGGTGRAGECARLCPPWSPVVEATRAALPPRARCTPRVCEGAARAQAVGTAGRWPQAARQQAGLSVAARTAGGRDTRVSGAAATATGSRFCAPGGEGDRPSVRRRAVPATRPAPTCPAPATLDGGASRNPLSPMDPLAFRAAAPMAGSAAALTGGGRGRACLLQEVWTRRAPPARPAERRGVPPQAAALPDRKSPAETPSRPPRCCVGVWSHAKHIVVIINAPGGLTGACVSV